jgi:hypothetical protein
LTEEGCVTLENGNVVKLTDCSDPAEPTKAFMVVFMEDESNIESFVNENNELLDKLHQQ